jgi:cell wall-associated NlpC family hydrolase
MVVWFALASAACAAHTASPATRPSPFPGLPRPASIRPALPETPGGVVSRADIIQTALGYQGVPYRYGGADPQTGFDCSGYIQYVMGLHSVQVPRTAAEQYRVGRKVAWRDIEAGDLVFFSTVAPGASHVGLALDNGTFVHAPATDGVVRTEPLTSSYWQSRFVGARRLFSE